MIFISYCEEDLNSAVDFISENNPFFKGEKNFIKNRIIDSMKNMAKDPDEAYTGTMGFLLICERQMEDMDNDQTICHFDIFVDPNVAYDLEEDPKFIKIKI